MSVRTVRRSAANAASGSMLDAAAVIAGTQLPALGNEVISDHANSVTFDTEVKADIGTIATFEAEAKTDIGTVATFQAEVVADCTINATWETEVDADLDDINDYVYALGEPNGVIHGDHTIAGAAATTIAVTGNVRYRIDGVEYHRVLPGTAVLEDSGDIVQNKFGAWSVLIDKLGALTTEDTGALMAFDSLEDALLNLSSRADTTAKVCIGYFAVTDSAAGGFNIGTTQTTGGTATESVYMVRGPKTRYTGLTAALGAATAVGTTPVNYSTGTRDYCINGLNVAQDAAEADKTFDDADTIGQSQFGGHLIVTNLAQNATYALAANGVAGSVSAMTYANSAAVDTAIDTLVDRLPFMFCPVSKIVVTNNIAGGFTYGTDDINGTDGTAVFTDCTAGVVDRTVASGFNSWQRNPPAVPASVTAPVVATMTAPAVVAMTAPAVVAMTASPNATLTASTAIDTITVVS